MYRTVKVLKKKKKKKLIISSLYPVLVPTMAQLPEEVLIKV